MSLVDSHDHVVRSQIQTAKKLVSSDEHGPDHHQEGNVLFG